MPRGKVTKNEMTGVTVRSLERTGKKSPESRRNGIYACKAGEGLEQVVIAVPVTIRTASKYTRLVPQEQGHSPLFLLNAHGL